MDAAHHRPAPVQLLRDRRGLVIGRLEEQGSTGRIIARDARGLIVGVYEPRMNVTRDARGLLVGTGNLLVGLLPR